MTLEDLARRLRDRAAASRRNAESLERSHYRGEAFAALERARAFDLAAEDAEAAGVPARGVGEASARFELLRWAGARPAVLALLGAVRDRGWDERAVGHLRDVVLGRDGQG